MITSHQQPHREIMIAIPGLPSDLYQMHQCVWEHAAHAAKPGKKPRFLYRVENGMVQVRGPDFRTGMVREFNPVRPVRLDIVAVKRSRVDGQIPVEASQLNDWMVGTLEKVGLKVRRLHIESYVIHRGIKRDRNTNRSHLIELPVARLQLKLDVQDQTLAIAAWSDGIGRGRRFGFGMLCH